MKKIAPLSLLIIASTYLSPTLATEFDDFYIGGLFTAQKIDIYSADRDFNTVGFVAGYQINDYFSLETRYSHGVSGDTYSFNSSDIPNEFDNSFDRDIDYQASLLIKASYPISNSFNIYATTGYAKSKFEVEMLKVFTDIEGEAFDYSKTTSDYTDDGFTYGIGLGYKISDNVDVFVDYQVLPDLTYKNGGSDDWDSINIGINYTF